MSRKTLAVTCFLSLSVVLFVSQSSKANPSYEKLKEQFATPDHDKWGEVPLWWWEGDPMDKERMTWQLKTLRDKGVKTVCPIQRSPARCDPKSFSDKWWKYFTFAHEKCKQLGMTIWAYDQVGYGHYGWLEKAAAKVGNTGTFKINFVSKDVRGGDEVKLELPDGKLLDARVYPIRDGIAIDQKSFDLPEKVNDDQLAWIAPEGTWRVTATVAVPFLSFHLNEQAANQFLEMFYGKLARQCGAENLGKSLAGVFQDEHPMTPRDLYTEKLAENFRERFGYDIARAIPALHFDVGPKTPKYRTDFFDVYLDEDERCYWKKVFDWTQQRNLLTSYDNWGRKNIYKQSAGYIDYYRTQRWFSAPGYDDFYHFPFRQRNYYDTKLASSIANMYDRSRVWLEGFHSSGWGRTTEQTLEWLSANYAFGANLYDEHGLYYSTRTSTWEHAAPDPHWRQPYWRYYQHISDWVSRLSYLMSQGTHVADAAVHYPVTSLLAGQPAGIEKPDYNHYMTLSRTLYDAGIDNDIIDDESIMRSTVVNGVLSAAGLDYRCLVFDREITMRLDVLRKALALARSGGTVIFYGGLPMASTDNGRDDPQVANILQHLLGISEANAAEGKIVSRSFDTGGYAAFVPQKPQQLPTIVSQHVQRDFVPDGGTVYVNHHRIGDTNVYLVQNAEDHPITLTARCRVDAVPERWDLFTGQCEPVHEFQRNGEYTTIRQHLEGNLAQLIVFRLGGEQSGGKGLPALPVSTKKLGEQWTFSVIPTRDNQWGAFQWPPSDELIGPERRAFRYREQGQKPDTELGWHEADFDDSDWTTARYSIGPYWLTAGPLNESTDVEKILAADSEAITPGEALQLADQTLNWQPVEFSKTIGRANPMLWGGHAGYPDGAIDPNFIVLHEGRKILFTRLRSPREQRRGLQVELCQSKARLWVNGREQPFEDTLGNLPLRQGLNYVFLELADGNYGRLYVQKQPPTAATLQEKVADLIQPDLKKASWIWMGQAHACYLRKTFDLSEIPEQARLVVTADNGYRLFVNGQRIEEEIGPWARWKFPERFNVVPYLRKGTNVIAAWGQDLGGPEGFALTLQARFSDGREMTITSDGTWKGNVQENAGWQTVEYKDAWWSSVKVLGPMGMEPWGMTAVNNVGKSTEPTRPLAVDLPSPYLTCFQEVPDIVYDVKPTGDRGIGWYRFQAPPGLQGMILHTQAEAHVWVDGQPAKVNGDHVTIPKPPTDMSQVAIRLDMQPGAYAGAAFTRPIELELDGGKIRLGPWADFGLPTYAGIGVYKQQVGFTADELKHQVLLDLGEVIAAAEVLVNGRSAGVRLARPYQFDLTELLQPGDNTIEVRVANTLAPHYTVTNKVFNLGPTTSGLLGPVTLELRPK